MSEQARDDLTPIEAALGQLSPAPPSIDRDRLMFLAGQASRPLTGWIWPMTSAGLAACVAVLLLRPVGAPPVPVVERRAPPPAVQPDNSVPRREPVEMSYLVLRGKVVEEGVEALPAPPIIDEGTPPILADDLELPLPRFQR